MNIYILFLDLPLLLKWPAWYVSLRFQQRLVVKKYMHMRVRFQLQVLLGIAGFIAPKSAVLVVICCALLFFGSGLSLGVTTCCMADVIDYGEVKFGVRNESVTCSAQTFLMKAATAAAGGLSGVGLQVVGYNAKAAVQSAGTILGIRVLMIVIPVILAVVSFLIYKKCYKLKGAAMEEVTEKVNEIHAQRIIVME